MKLFIVSIAILISSTIAQTEKYEDDLSSQIDKEYQNVEHLLASLDNARLQEGANDPVCLKQIIRSGVSRIRSTTDHFKRWMYNENITSTSKLELGQQSDLSNHSRVSLDSKDMNITIHRLRDIYSSLNVAINTIRYMRQDFHAELEKDQVKEEYDVEGELKMECDALKGILGITTQLARRLVPPRIRKTIVPPRNPIIRVVESILKF